MVEITTPMQLVSYKLCPFVQRARYALEAISLPYEVTYIDPSQTKPDWFAAISPFGKVPVLVVGETPLVESAIILEFINDYTGNTLLPEDALLRAKHRLLIYELDSFHTLLGQLSVADNADDFAKNVQQFSEKIMTIDNRLVQMEYTLGQEGLLEFSYAPMLNIATIIGDVCSKNLFDGTVFLSAWKDQMLASPFFKKSMADDYLSEMLNFLSAQNSLLSEYVSTFSIE